MTFLPATGAQETIPESTGLLRGGPLVAGVEVTLVRDEAHNLAAQVTQIPMESGAQVSDHIVLEPLAVTIGYEVSNVGEGRQQAKDVFETFKNILEKRELLELVTEHYVYANMALVSVSPFHSAPYKGRLQFTANLQQINFVEIESVGKAPAKLSGSGSTQKTASAEVKDGEQNTPEVTQSALKKIKDKNS